MPRPVLLARGRDPDDRPWEPTRLPTWPELLTPVVINLLAELRLSAAINTVADQWHPFHTARGVSDFEYEHGVAGERWEYNARCFQRARDQKQRVMGEHAGFCDFFVPVHSGGTLRGMLVCGPFATSRPSSAEIARRWWSITESHGRLSDPGFSAYVEATLSTLTLDRAQVEALDHLLGTFADLLVQRGNAEQLTARIEKQRRILVEARFAERMWDTARSMIDERSPRVWDAHGQLSPIGMRDLPTHVVVGLVVDTAEDGDALGAVLRRDAFQRASVDLAKKLGRTAAGKVGDHGVTFLADRKGGAARARAWLTDLVAHARRLARAHGLSLHAGISQSSQFEDLPARYHEALWAAEKALSQGASVVYGEPQRELSTVRLRSLRSELARSVEQRPNALVARFDRYVEAVLAHSGYRIDAARSHLEAGLERLTEPLLSRGILDERSARELHASMDRAAEGVTTVVELVSSFRRCVAEIEATLKNPVVARQDRSTERALAFIREHSSERLALAQVAKIAGFAPDYFSALFKREQGKSFARYVLESRIERAKHMLRGTALSVEQIQELCGFHNRTYFHRAFKRLAGSAPAEYRAAERANPARGFSS